MFSPNSHYKVLLTWAARELLVVFNNVKRNISSRKWNSFPLTTIYKGRKKASMDKNFLFTYKTSKNPFFFLFQEKGKVTLILVNIFLYFWSSGINSCQDEYEIYLCDSWNAIAQIREFFAVFANEISSILTAILIINY